MVKALSFSGFRTLIRICVLFIGLLFLSHDVFALLHSAGGNIVTTYDVNGNLDLITKNKPGNIVEFTDHDYDLLDRLERKTQRGHVVSYSYDNNGNRLTVTSPGGTTTNTFDTRNRLETVTTHSGTTVYTYLPTGWTDVVTHGNGTQVDYDYDSVGRTLKITNRAANNSVLSQFDYEYDLNGNRTQQIEIQNGFANTADRTRTTDYVYDDLDRLESFSHAAGSNTENHGYTYYPSYDRKTETVVKNGVTINNRTYTYDETHWVKTIVEAAGTGGVITYAYDNNGNSLSKTSTVAQGPASTVFTYNSRNQLKTFAAGAAGSEVNKGTYHYNYAGMRIRHLGSERGNIEYVYDDKSIIDELSNNTATQVAHYSYGDRLLSLKTGSVEQFYHYAALGTTANLTNTSGQNQIAYRVDPFGEITQQEGTSLNRQVFTGHEHDTETGLIYMKARFYDPDIGRFINQDTYLGESTTPPSLHRYLYAYGNPTYYTDPLGYKSCADNEAADNCDPGTGLLAKRSGESPITVGDDLGKGERQSEFDRWCAQQGGDCDPFVFDNLQGQKAKQRGLMTGEGDPGQSLSTCPEEAIEICQDRQRLANHTKRIASGVASTANAAASFHPAVAATETIQMAESAIQFIENNPGLSLSAGSAAACSAVAKCRNVAKAAGGKVWNSVESAGSKSKKGLDPGNGSFDAEADFGYLNQPHNAADPTGYLTRLKSIKDIEVGGLTAKRIAQGDNGKIAIIGRSMGNKKIKGVKDYAEALRRQGYDVELFDGDVIPESAAEQFERLTNKDMLRDSRNISHC